MRFWPPPIGLGSANGTKFEPLAAANDFRFRTGIMYLRVHTKSSFVDVLRAEDVLAVALWPAQIRSDFLDDFKVGRIGIEGRRWEVSIDSILYDPDHAVLSHAPLCISSNMRIADGYPRASRRETLQQNWVLESLLKTLRLRAQHKDDVLLRPVDKGQRRSVRVVLRVDRATRSCNRNEENHHEDRTAAKTTDEAHRRTIGVTLAPIEMVDFIL